MVTTCTDPSATPQSGRGLRHAAAGEDDVLEPGRRRHDHPGVVEAAIRTAPPGPFHLYLLWAGDVPLYVGQTEHLRKRMNRHALNDWWPSITRLDLRGFPSRREVLAAEEAAIDRLRPVHNRTGAAVRDQAFAAFESDHRARLNAELAAERDRYARGRALARELLTLAATSLSPPPDVFLAHVLRDAHQALGIDVDGSAL